MKKKQPEIIPTSLEVYVKEYGIFGTLGLLKSRIKTESDYLLKEFFITCQQLLIHSRDGKIRDADNYFQAHN